MHLSTGKTIRMFLALAVAAQCSIAEAKRADRRILNRAPVKRVPVSAPVSKGRDLTTYPVANGLETTGIGYSAVGVMPGGGAHVTVQAPTSCMPGQPNCAMPNQIQANMNPIPDPPMWPLLLQAAMRGFGGMMGGGSNQSRAGLRGDQSPVPPGRAAGSPSRTGRPSDDAAIPPGGESSPVSHSPKGIEPGTTAQPDAKVAETLKSCSGKSVLSSEIKDQTASTIKGLQNQPLKLLKHSGPTDVTIQAIGAGNYTLTRMKSSDPNLILCQMVLKVLDTRELLMRMVYELPQNRASECSGGSSIRTCGALVTLGDKTGIKAVHIEISNKDGSATEAYLKAPAPTAVAEPYKPAGPPAATDGGRS